MGNERLSSCIFLLLLFAVLRCFARPQTAQDDSGKGEKINITEPETSFFVHATSKTPGSQNVDSSLSSTRHPVNGGTAGSRGLSSTKQPPLRESIKSVADQLLGADDEASVEAQMIQSDVRTPPGVQAQTHFKKKVVTSHQEEEDKKKKEKGDPDLVGQGVAVPVILEEDEDIKRAEEMLLPSRGGTPKPSAGISTWVLLSGSGNTTPPVPQPLSPSTAAKVSKKTTTTTTSTPAATQTTKKPQRTTTTAEVKPHTKPPSNASNNKLVHQFRPLLHGSASNKATTTSGTTTTAASVTTITTTSTTPAGPTITTTRQPSQTSRPNKNKHQNKNDTTSEDSTAQARRPVSSSVQAEGGKQKTTTTTTTQTPTKMKKTTTVAPVTTTVITTTVEPEVGESTATAVTTTKRTRRPGSNGTKKRKKNKNKRRKRPTTNNATEVSDEGEATALTGLETTVLEIGNATKTNKDKDKRPLSTRIYNYLAREVMPSVGVGLIGLMVTAGLAGLIMYPFGGGLTPAARRTYEEQHTSAPQLPYYRNRFQHQHHQQQTGPFLYYEGAEDPNSGQAEEAVLEQVLDGMGEPSRYDSDAGTDTVVSSYDPQGGFKYPTVSATDSPPYRVQYASTGAPKQQPSTTTSTVRPYYRPSTIQRVEATPKYTASVAASPAALHHVGVEKFYGSEAKPSVNSRTGSEQQAAPSRKVFDLTDRQGSAAADVTFGGGRVRFREVGAVDHQQPIQQTSAIAEHGPRSLRKRRELRSDVGKADAAQDMLENAIGTGEKKEGWPVKKDAQELPKMPEAQTMTTPVIETTTSQEATTFEASRFVTTPTSSPEEQQQITTEAKSSDISVMTTTGRLSNDVENTTIVGDVDTKNISQISATTLGNSNVTVPELEITGESTEDNSSPPSSNGETFSFMGLVRRIAQVKLNLGLNFLKNTSDAFGKYIENVQKRMSETLSEADNVRYKAEPSAEPDGFWDTVRRIHRHIQRGYRSVVNGRRPQRDNEKRE